MTSKKLIEYLQQFPDDAIPCFIVANPKDRKYHEMTNVFCITDMDQPVFCVEVGIAQDMDEEMVKACEEDEAQAALEKKNKPKQYVLVSQGIEIYRTTDKEEAERMMNESNAEYYDYLQRCADEGERAADNMVYMYEEE